ncbi:MAG: hypothetical protein LBV58_01800 [Acholeplasmatales bacterium]|nr:hypothetical protein [Acholeplasmatales bacterium]
MAYSYYESRTAERGGRSKNSGNSIFGKIIRFLSYVGLLVVGFYAVVSLLGVGQAIYPDYVSFLSDIVLIDFVLNVFKTIQTYIGGYVDFIFLGALFLLIWVFGKSTFGKIVGSLLFLVGIGANQIGKFVIDPLQVPEFLRNILTENSSVFTGIVDSSIAPYAESGGLLLSFLVVLLVVSTRKPKRIHTFFLRSALFFVILNLIITIALKFIDLSGASYVVYINVGVFYLLLVSYTFIVISSVFGILGAFKA